MMSDANKNGKKGTTTIKTHTIKIILGSFINVIMGATGVYYRREMQRMLLGYGCILCERGFETSDKTNARYPYISPVCKHTLCKLCLDKTISWILVREFRTVDCPFCRKEKRME
jgi:hypothetical protein